MTTVHVKFPSEAAHAPVTVPAPATPAGVCAAVLAARPDLGKLLDAKGQYAGFELSLVDPKTGRPMDPGVDDAIPNDAKMELVLSKGYAVRAFAPVRKYVVGRFSGEKPPKFKSGRATAVEWQLCRQRSDMTTSAGREPNLQLVSESKKGGRVQFNGSRESGSLGNFFLLMMQANTTDVCAIPMEQWYNFRPVANRRVISLEEAEERLEARGRHTTSTSQWLEKAAGLKGGNGGDLEDDALSDSDDADRFKTQAGDTDSDDDDNEYDKKKKRRKKGGAGGGVGVKQEPIEDEAKAGDDVGEVLALEPRMGGQIARLDGAQLAADAVDGPALDDAGHPPVLLVPQPYLNSVPGMCFDEARRVSARARRAARGARWWVGRGVRRWRARRCWPPSPPARCDARTR